jgi:hypothetical protein
MLDPYTRITVPLSREEFIALSKAAQGELRHPRDHARFILRSFLLCEQSDQATNANTHADRQVKSVGVPA